MSLLLENTSLTLPAAVGILRRIWGQFSCLFGRGSVVLRVAVLAIFCLPAISSAEIKAEAYTLGKLYSSPYSEEVASQSLTDFGLSLRGSSGDEYRFLVDASLIYATSEIENELFVSVPELSVNYKAGSDKIWSLGRRLKRLSLLDSFWTLGVLNSFSRWNPFAAKEQGMVGVHFTRKHKLFNTTFIASPIHIPDQSPKVETQDGEFVTGQRSFRNRIETVSFGNLESDLYFEIADPVIEDILFQPVFGFVFETTKETGVWARLSLFDKPSSQLFFGFEISPTLTSTTTSGDTTPVTINPISVRHQVYSVDVGWRSDRSMIAFSVIHERPELPELNPDWEQSKLEENTFLSFTTIMDGNLLNMKLTQVYFSLLQRFENRLDDTPITKDEDVADRFNFKQALMVGFQSPLSFRGLKPIRSDFRFISDTILQGSLVNFALEMQVSEKFSVNTQATVIGAVSSAKGFFFENQANDSLQLGAKYVF